MAVLYRTNAQSRNFEEAFSSFGIPYQVVGGVRYYDRKEIKDMMSYMRLVVDPRDDLALSRIINAPRRGVGPKTLAKLAGFAAARGISLLELLADDEITAQLSPKVRQAVRSMVEVLTEYAQDAAQEKPTRKVSDVYDGLMVRTGYIAALEEQNTVEAESRIENLLEFKTVIMEYEHEDPELTISAFMEKIALVSDIDNRDTSENAVTLMTLHSAKGLEFPVVFMPGMEEGLFPGQRAAESIGGIEEERRLCYVGMTRAMEKLYLLRAKSRTIYGRFENTLESRFLREIDKDYLDGAANIGKETTHYFHEPMGAEDGFSAPEVIRPFDQLKSIKERIAKTSATPIPKPQERMDYTPGTKVTHAKFGSGIIISSDATTVTVMFDEEGKKKFVKDLAKLRMS
jgi:DNA helicase-2/ATP-dependent DNA helicase PcrA